MNPTLAAVLPLFLPVRHVSCVKELCRKKIVFKGFGSGPEVVGLLPVWYKQGLFRHLARMTPANGCIRVTPALLGCSGRPCWSGSIREDTGAEDVEKGR